MAMMLTRSREQYWRYQNNGYGQGNPDAVIEAEIMVMAAESAETADE
jgi:hypothetical protein